jgi:hypothetical protein
MMQSFLEDNTIFQSSALPTELPSRKSREYEVPRGSRKRILSRSVNFNRVDRAVMAMHIEGNWTTAHFAILYGGKRAGRSIDNRGERRSAVGAHNLRLYLEFHERNLSIKKRDWLAWKSSRAKALTKISGL